MKYLEKFFNFLLETNSTELINKWAAENATTVFANNSMNPSVIIDNNDVLKRETSSFFNHKTIDNTTLLFVFYICFSILIVSILISSIVTTIFYYRKYRKLQARTTNSRIFAQKSWQQSKFALNIDDDTSSVNAWDTRSFLSLLSRRDGGNNHTKLKWYESTLATTMRSTMTPPSPPLPLPRIAFSSSKSDDSFLASLDAVISKQRHQPPSVPSRPSSSVYALPNPDIWF